MTDSHTIFRILDANANRAAEGLRVVEEYLRFALGDRHLTESCKQLRHELAGVLQQIPELALMQARDVGSDVGTAISTAEEFQRGTPRDIFAANQKRVEQSLRCLEEYSKPLDSAIAARVEQLRYRAYTLARAVVTTERSCERLADSRLYVLIDAGPDEDTLTRLVPKLVAAGVHLLQLRDKRLTDRELLERARQVRALTRGTSTLFIMNDRPDLAALTDADGVHVGQEELRVHDVRAIVGTNRLIGVSTHSIEQARAAVLDGADYLGCGPVFPSETKSFDQFPGIAFLRQVAAEISLPAFAIGGVSLDTMPQVIEAGFSRVAVAGAVANAADPENVVRQVLERLTHAPIAGEDPRRQASGTDAAGAARPRPISLNLGSSPGDPSR
jgi:thiamine-phosphate pyrophosphorylase